MATRFTLIVIAFVLAAGPAHAQVFSDDFNDGDDAGWTRYQPLEPFGAGGTYAFPGGGYRITAPPSPSADTLGVNRVGAIADGVVVGDTFELSVDILDWGPGAQTGIGLFARAAEMGLGTSDGYYLHANVGGSDPPALSLDVIVNEFPSSSLAFAAASVTTGMDLRLVLAANGPALTGNLYDLANLSTPLATITATDSTYSSGGGGVITTGLADLATGELFNDPLDATFDNFNLVPEPSSLALLLLTVAMLRRRYRGV